MCVSVIISLMERRAGRSPIKFVWKFSKEFIAAVNLFAPLKYQETLYMEQMFTEKESFPTPNT